MNINHLIIQQPTSSIEVVASSIIDKLYELAQNPSLDANSTIQGNLQCTHAYEDAVTYLLNKFPGLQINVTGGAYIRFSDSAVASICATNWGDGTGVTLIQARTVVNFNNMNPSFYHNTNVKSFNELPKFTNLTIVPVWCFENCTFTSIDLSNMTEIQQGGFNGCSSLLTVNITNKCTKIGASAFVNSSNVVNFGDLSGVQTLESDGYCFDGCNSMTNQDLKLSGTIGSHTFRSCYALPKIDLTNITYIGTYAFEGCRSLADIVSLENVTLIDQAGFIGCSLLTVVNITNKCTRINDQAFCNCYALTSLGDLSGVTYIGSRIASDTLITSVNLSEGLTYIGYEAFARTKLDSITLPSTFTTMGGSEFSDTNTPRWAKCLATTPPNGCNSYSFKNGGTYPIYVPDASLATYKAASGWSSFSSRILPLSQFATDFPNG